MQQIILRRVKRRNPFKVERLPWITRIYRFPFEKWNNLGKQALFGAFNFLTFFAYQRLMPLKARGTFTLSIDGAEKRILFNTANTMFSSLYFSMYAEGYEPEVAALLDTIMPERGTFYDIGSNWGYFSLYVASKPNFRGNIHAFEPFPSTYRDLKSVVEQAALGSRIRLHNHALADRCGRANIAIPDFLNSGWATLVDDSGDRVKSQEKVIEVATLDSLSLDPPSVMKIDVERSEAKVLRGATALLARHRPLIVFESLRAFKEPGLTLEPFRILHEAGYVFFRPAWLWQDGSSRFLLGWDGNVEAFPTDVLALVPLNPEQRFLHPDVLNLFACHRESLPQIESLFNERLD